MFDLCKSARLCSPATAVALHLTPCGHQTCVEVGDEVRVNLHHGKIEDAVVRAVIQDDDGIKLQVDVIGLDLTALIDTRQVVDD